MPDEPRIGNDFCIRTAKLIDAERVPGDWIVYKYAWHDGVSVGQCRVSYWDVYREFGDGYTFLYGPCSYKEADDFVEDVKDLILKASTH